MLQFNTWPHAVSLLLVILGGGLVVGKVTEKPRVPDVAAYLAYGFVIGPAVLGWVAEPGSSQTTQFLFNLGAALILFEGGRGVQLAILRRVYISLTLLVTVGVLVTAAVVAISARALLGTPWLVSMMMGAVIAATDPATLIPVFLRVPIVARLRQTVESESAFNDATSSVLVLTLLGFASGHASSWLHPIGAFFQSAGIGMGVGLVIGLASLWLISPQGWGGLHEYGSVVLLTAAIAAFQFATIFDASGYMAAFVAGVVSANGRSFSLSLSDHTEHNVHHYGAATTLVFRMLIFVLLGSQIDLPLIRQVLWPGLLIVAIFMFVARPLTVLTCVLVDRRSAWQKREVAFMCWVRETGVIPAALSGMLIARRATGADLIGAVTFLAIFCTILVQATSTGPVARWLGVSVSGAVEDL